jgi:hypothetical protein
VQFSRFAVFRNIPASDIHNVFEAFYTARPGPAELLAMKLRPVQIASTTGFGVMHGNSEKAWVLILALK